MKKPEVQNITDLYKPFDMGLWVQNQLRIIIKTKIDL